MNSLNLREIYSNLSVKELSDKEKKEIKEILLQMLEDIVKLCEDNNINYTLGGGTALGCIRHHGFIPWDDDIDINVYRMDYLKLLKLIDETFSDKYEINAPNYSLHPKNRFAKIYRKHTTYIQINDINNLNPNGVFIDIFPIEHVPNNKLLYLLHGILSTLLMFIASSVYGRKYEVQDIRLVIKKNNKYLYYFRNIIGVVFSFLQPEKWFCIVDKVNSLIKKSDYLSSPTGRKHYFGEKILYSNYFPAVDGEFENLKVKLPNNYDVYLKNLFGDYLTIPKKEDRERHFIVNYQNQINFKENSNDGK